VNNGFARERDTQVFDVEEWVSHGSEPGEIPFTAEAQRTQRAAEKK
jgi:hypothetical protein